MRDDRNPFAVAMADRDLLADVADFDCNECFKMLQVIFSRYLLEVFRWQFLQRLRDTIIHLADDL